MEREKFSCKSHRLQATESPSVSSGLVWTAPLCTWIYYAIHVRVYINCYVERARALYQCICIHNVCIFQLSRDFRAENTSDVLLFGIVVKEVRGMIWLTLKIVIFMIGLLLFLNLFYDDIYAQMEDAFNKKLWIIFKHFHLFLFFHICKIIIIKMQTKIKNVRKIPL